MNFRKEKEDALKKKDLSRKGAIDSHIVELVNFINLRDSYFTTSSCSGRTIVFTNSKSKKVGCEWMFVSHEVVTADSIIDALHSHSGSAILKFEPFVLHTQCLTIEDARKMLNFGIQAGFKNSGISIGKNGKIIVAIRNTLSLEVPLSSEGTMLVSNEYISYVVNTCNEKMLNNWGRIERFFANLQSGYDLPKENDMSKKTTSKLKSDKPFWVVCDKKSDSLEEPDDFYDGFSCLLNRDSN